MKKLTLKQQRFVNSYLRTGNAKESAKIAGYEGNEHTLEQMGYENLRKPEVTAALAAALKPEEDLRDRVVAEVKLLAFSPSDEPLAQSHKLKALEILAKFTQMFDDAPKVNVTIPDSLRDMTAEQLEAELKRIEERKARRIAEEAVWRKEDTERRDVPTENPTLEPDTPTDSQFLPSAELSPLPTFAEPQEALPEGFVRIEEA